MSNKTQLQTNNTKLDTLITRVNTAKDTAASLPDAGGNTPTETMEEWFSGDAEFDVTNAATFIAHAPEVGYQNIDSVGTDTIVDANVLYTDSVGQGWMYATDGNSNARYIKCTLGIDVNGFDTLIPTAPSGTIQHYIGGGNTELIDVTESEYIEINTYNSYMYESVDTLPDNPAEGIIYTLPDGTSWMRGYSEVDEFGTPIGVKCVQCFIDVDINGGDSPAPIVPESSGSSLPTFSTWESMLEALTTAQDEDLFVYDGEEAPGHYSMTYTNEDGMDFTTWIYLEEIPGTYVASIVKNVDNSSIGLLHPINTKQASLLDGSSSIVVDNSVSIIRSGGFYSYTNLNTVSFPNATAVYSNAFYNCTNLTYVSLPLVSTIGVYGFQSCNKLESIELPNVTSIAQGAFYGCSKLSKIVVGANKTKVCSLSNINAFTNTPIANGTGYIYVPDNLVDSYKSATNWSNYASQIKGISEITW